MLWRCKRCWLRRVQDDQSEESGSSGGGALKRQERQVHRPGLSGFVTDLFMPFYAAVLDNFASRRGRKWRREQKSHLRLQTYVANMSKFVQLWARCCSLLIFTSLYKQFKGECLAVIHLSPRHTYNTQKICESLPSWLHSTFLPHSLHCRCHVHGNV